MPEKLTTIMEIQTWRLARSRYLDAD